VRNNGPELIVPLSADQGRPPGELFLVRGARPGLTGARAARRTRTEARTNGDYRRP